MIHRRRRQLAKEYSTEAMSSLVLRRTKGHDSQDDERFELLQGAVRSVSTWLDGLSWFGCLETEILPEPLRPHYPIDF